MSGPTELEQYELELINRMRLNPAAELSQLVSSISPLTAVDPTVQQDLTFFNVNGTVLAQQWGTLTAAPPLAWSDALAASSLTHDQLMVTNNNQTHNEPGEADLLTRIEAAGYSNPSSVRESIFSYASSIPEAHAAFAIDWGTTSTGIQDPPGHRENIMATDVRDIGIAVIQQGGAGYPNVGPLVVTEDYGGSFDETEPDIVGVAFQDTAGTGCYLPGEELPGITVTVGGATTATLLAGGYQMTVTSGNIPVTFTGGGLPSPLGVTLSVGTDNVKLDVIGLTAIEASASMTLGENVTEGKLLGTAALSLIGNDLGDTLVTNAGNDTITGGTGNNTAVFAADLASYTLFANADVITVALSGGPTDTLTNIQTLRFADASIPASSVACFVAGTRIATPDNEVPVELLLPGDVVLLARGAVGRVVWLGRRRIDCRRHPRPHGVWPVLVRAGAFAPCVPKRDLLLSPDHAVFAGHVLIPIRHLLNGTTVVQCEVDTVLFYHVELERHDVLLAEDLPVESYLPTGDRDAFENAGRVVRLHPTFGRTVRDTATLWDALACAPLRVVGPEIDRLRQRLARRAVSGKANTRRRND